MEVVTNSRMSSRVWLSSPFTRIEHAYYMSLPKLDAHPSRDHSEKPVSMSQSGTLVNTKIADIAVHTVEMWCKLLLI